MQTLKAKLMEQLGNALTAVEENPGQIVKGAMLSEDQTRRYFLWRIWDDEEPLLVWVMLNPSTADASVDDPTVKRCMAFANHLGFGGILIVNLYSLRTPSPAVLKAARFPVNPIDQEVLRAALWYADIHAFGEVVLAWGNNAPDSRVKSFGTLLERTDIKTYVFGLTQSGAPKHPLARGKHRIPDDTIPSFYCLRTRRLRYVGPDAG